VEKTKTTLMGRAARIGYTRAIEINTGINRRRQINLFDPTAPVWKSWSRTPWAACLHLHPPHYPLVAKPVAPESPPLPHRTRAHAQAAQ